MYISHLDFLCKTNRACFKNNPYNSISKDSFQCFCIFWNINVIEGVLNGAFLLCLSTESITTSVIHPSTFLYLKKKKRKKSIHTKSNLMFSAPFKLVVCGFYPQTNLPGNWL